MINIYIKANSENIIREKMTKKSYNFLTIKNKRTGEVLEIKPVSSISQGLDEQEKFRKTDQYNEDIEMPILGTYAQNAEDAIANIKSMYPEHSLDSRGVVKEFEKYQK